MLLMTILSGCKSLYPISLKIYPDNVRLCWKYVLPELVAYLLLIVIIFVNDVK